LDDNVHEIAKSWHTDEEVKENLPIIGQLVDYRLSNCLKFIALMLLGWTD